MVSHLEEKLQEVYFYQMIAHKHELAGYHQKHVTALIQAQKMEQKIVAEYRKASFHAKLEIKNMITQFAQRSSLHGTSVERLNQELNLNCPTSTLSSLQFKEQIVVLEKTLEFQVFENNVEHLSYMLETNARL